MVESWEHLELKRCIAEIFGGRTEKVIDGRVDVMARGFCVEIELSDRTDRLSHARVLVELSEHVTAHSRLTSSGRPVEEGVYGSSSLNNGPQA